MLYSSEVLTRSVDIYWSSGTPNSGDFRGDSQSRHGFHIFFFRGDSFPSVFGVLHPSPSLRGLKFQGLWCRSSLLLIGWLWAQLSSGSTHCTYVRAFVHRNMSLYPFLPKLWTMPSDLHIGKFLRRGLNNLKIFVILYLGFQVSKHWRMPYFKNCSIIHSYSQNLPYNSQKLYLYICFVVCLHTSIII